MPQLDDRDAGELHAPLFTDPGPSVSGRGGTAGPRSHWFCWQADGSPSAVLTYLRRAGPVVERLAAVLTLAGQFGLGPEQGIYRVSVTQPNAAIPTMLWRALLSLPPYGRVPDPSLRGLHRWKRLLLSAIDRASTDLAICPLLALNCRTGVLHDLGMPTSREDCFDIVGLLTNFRLTPYPLDSMARRSNKGGNTTGLIN